MVQTDSTGSSRDVSTGRGLRTLSPLVQAWIWVVLVPVFFLAAFAAAQGIYALTGYDPSAGATAPRWADLAAALPFLAILLIPCIAGVVYGRRAARAGVRAGLAPAAVAALLGVGALLLVVL
jgi:hypothetical protein